MLHLKRSSFGGFVAKALAAVPRSILSQYGPMRAFCEPVTGPLSDAVPLREESRPCIVLNAACGPEHGLTRQVCLSRPTQCDMALSHTSTLISHADVLNKQFASCSWQLRTRRRGRKDVAVQPRPGQRAKLARPGNRHDHMM